MSVPPESIPNPYIGPRAFQIGEQIYGRNQEAAQLVNLLIAERIVLLYSPSGAGKTSLIQATLIPRLLKTKFHVPPVIRVNLQPPRTVDDDGTERTSVPINRYVFSTLVSLEDEMPPEQQTPLELLAMQTLPEYLARRPKPPGDSGVEVLVFDQFEEILSLDPTDRASKRDFFNQLGEALEQSHRWALFAMREDYIGALDPYKLPIPNRLAVTFRLDLLDSDSARLAIQEPARRAGVDFTDAAATALANDLRRVRVQQPDGTLEPRLGPFIEPVQLQVVCHQLWSSLPQPAKEITQENLQTPGQSDQSFTDQSLLDYYEQSVSGAAEWATERRIREWFDRQLITEQGMRGTVLMAHDQSSSLDNRAISSLINSHLVRAEHRAGATWFELSHDRLIAPIRKSNAEWFKAHLSLLQQRADVWMQQRRPESLLLQGKELDEAKNWAASHRAELLPAEADYLAAGETLAVRALRLKRRNQIISALGIVAIVLAVLAFLAWRQALIERDNAAQQARFARAGQLAAQASSVLTEDPALGQLLAIEGLYATKPDEPPPTSAQEALRAAVAETHGLRLRGQSGPVQALAISPDGHWLATTSEGADARLWDLNNPDLAAEPKVLPGLDGDINALAFSPAGQWLATGSDDDKVRLWKLPVTTTDPVVLETLGAGVESLSFSPDGNRLAAGNASGRVDVWALDAVDPPANPQILNGIEGIDALAFSPDNRWLAAGGGNKNTFLWDLRSPDPDSSRRVLSGHTGIIKSLAFSRDGHWLATGSVDGTARVWDLMVSDPSAQPLAPLQGHTDVINVLAFSPDDQLATGSGDKTVRIWNLNDADPSAHSQVLIGHTEAITTLAFSPDGKWLATGSHDKTGRLWNIESGEIPRDPIVLRGHADWINALAFSPDGGRLVTGSKDASVRVWSVDGTDPYRSPSILNGHPAAINDLAISRDGRTLVTGGGDKTIWMWDLRAANPAANPLVLKDSTGIVGTLDYSPDGRWLVSGSQNGTARLWDLSAHAPVESRLILDAQEPGSMPLAFSPNSRWLAIGSPDYSIRLWDLNATDPFGASRSLVGHTDVILAIAASPDNRWLATGGRDNIVRLWNLISDDPAVHPLELEGHGDEISALKFSPDGRWLTSGSHDSTLRLWDMRAADPAASPLVLSGHTDWVNALAFNSDGSVLASGSSDNNVILWNIRDADPSSSPLVLPGHRNWVNALTFSPSDDRFLASASNDHTVRLWDMRAANPAADPLILSHADSVTSLAFTPDGRRLATGSRDGSARIWLLDWHDLIELACGSAGRNLSEQEWRTYFSGIEYHRTCDQFP